MSVNLILVIVTCVVSYLAFRSENLLKRLILHPYTVIRERQYYRLLASGFIHNGWIHLIFNMVALFFFGANIEYIFGMLYKGAGGLVYLIFYLTGIIVSDLSTMRKNRDNPAYFSLGASGGVSAIIFCWILYFPTQTIYLYFLPIPGFILGILYLVYSFYQSKRADSHINHEAHLYGSLYGILFTVLTNPAVVPRFIEQLSGFQLF